MTDDHAPHKAERFRFFSDIGIAGALPILCTHLGGRECEANRSDLCNRSFLWRCLRRMMFGKAGFYKNAWNRRHFAFCSYRQRMQLRTRITRNSAFSLLFLIAWGSVGDWWVAKSQKFQFSAQEIMPRLINVSFEGLFARFRVSSDSNQSQSMYLLFKILYFRSSDIWWILTHEYICWLKILQSC